MGKKHYILAVTVLAAVWTSAAMADKNSDSQKSRPPLGNNPYPVISGGQSSKPVPPAPQPPAGKADHRESGRSYYFGGYSYGGYPYGYDSDYYGSFYPYPYAYPPLYVPAEELYGPQAVRRFMGYDDGFQPGASANIVAPRTHEDENTDLPEPKKAMKRATNAQSSALAWRFIGFGDAQFAEQKFSDANGRYRKAAEAAPQLADPLFRQAFALSAIGRYDLAVGAIKRGLKLNPNWAKSDFTLKELYGADELAKDARMDALAAAAEEKPNDANLLFLVGVHLHFDGQAPRAEKFFRRALEIAGDDAEHIRAFMEK